MFAISPPSSAQASKTEGTPPDAANDAGLAEIVVTAQRRESLQKAAIPVSVISTESLARAGVSSPDGRHRDHHLAVGVPLGRSRMTFFLRGVGNFTANPLFDSAVAFNYDNVYIDRPAGSAGVFYDLERVEVLKGPARHALWSQRHRRRGQRPSAQAPTGQLQRLSDGTYGNYDAYTLEGAVNVPMGENGALRVSGNVVKHDGYMSDGSQDDDTQGLRVQMAARAYSDALGSGFGDLCACGWHRVRSGISGARALQSVDPDLYSGLDWAGQEFGI